jgi:Glyoxalase/Bleomycin resistance protein/Dioxygenase superfamily
MRSLSDLFRNFLQLGYVTDDIDAAAAFLQASMGTGKCVMSYRSSLGGGLPPAVGSPASPGSPRPAFVVVDGKPADEWMIDVALVNAGPVNLEVIRPVDGAVDLYRDGVRPGAPVTLHHVGFVVDDFDEASAVVAASGRSWTQFGDSGEIRFGYLDLRAELGHFVEVMELGQPAAQWMARIDAASAASLATAPAENSDSAGVSDCLFKTSSSNSG